MERLAEVIESLALKEEGMKECQAMGKVAAQWVADAICLVVELYCALVRDGWVLPATPGIGQGRY